MRDFLHFSRDHSSMNREGGKQKSTFCRIQQKDRKTKTARALRAV